MARQRSPSRDLAMQIWLESKKKKLLKDIAAELDVSEEQVRKWKSQDKWDKVTLPKSNSNVIKAKGGQKGNKNAVGHGAPPQNKNAEKYGFFSRYLPEETFSIILEIDQKDTIDILWENIQIAYAAIVRAQQIMYVSDKDDMSSTKVGYKECETSTEERWEVQYAWDKQASFLKAQSRAQAELRSMIRQYEELLNKNWELATEEQRLRINILKSQVKTDQGEQVEDWKKAIIEIAKKRKEKNGRTY